MTTILLRSAIYVLCVLLAAALTWCAWSRHGQDPLTKDLIVAGTERMSIEWKGRPMEQFIEKYGPPSEETGSGFQINIYEGRPTDIRVIGGNGKVVRIRADTDEE